jgi:hypothetical protein
VAAEKAIVAHETSPIWSTIARTSWMKLVAVASPGIPSSFGS